MGYRMRKGKFNAQQLANPQGQHSVDISIVLDIHLEHLKLVTTLRSGKEIKKITYLNPSHIEAPKPSAVIFERLEPLNSELQTVFKEKRKEPMPYQIPAPFLQRL